MKNKIILLFVCVCLSACASTPATNNQAKSAAANNHFVPAVEVTHSLKQAKTPIKGYKAKTPKVGRLHVVPLNIKPYQRHKLQGIAAVKSANKKALQKPKSEEYFNSIMTYDFMPGALYKVYCAPLSVTDIQLQPGEHVVSVAGGDTLRWQVSKTYSGSGPSRQEHILVKPTDEGLTNSLVITTDQRTYHLALQSTSGTYMAAAQWRYPQDDKTFVQTFGKDLAAQQSVVDTQDVALEKLDFDYLIQIVGDKKTTPKPAWLPKMVFNDGKKTYIQFPENIQEAPTLFIGGWNNTRVVNYRVEGNYYVIDGVFKQMQLRRGQAQSEIVLITHK